LISGSPATHGSSAVDRRGFAAAATGGEPPLSPDEVRKRMDAINDSFAEAREEIECAMEAVGTTFFNEEAEYAQEVTGKVLGEEGKLNLRSPHFRSPPTITSTHKYKAFDRLFLFLVLSRNSHPIPTPNPTLPSTFRYATRRN